MAETLIVPKTANRAEVYEVLFPQLKALLEGETDLVANLANFTAVLKEAFGFLWIGFYLVKENQLVLGPFQGPIACTRIPFTRGVCGHCYSTGKTVIVPDVDQFLGHIACSSSARSEIVVPVYSGSKIIAVLDVDSANLNDFSEVDAKYLESFVSLLPL